MNWGFLGFGRIARKFIEGLKLADGEVAYALASRSNARHLQEEHPDKKVYSSYADLISDEAVDIIYVSTTHNFHKDNVIEALKGGKHVLCEKPMGLTRAEVEEMTEVARQEGRFLMEGLWSRFLPGYQKAIELVKSGHVGDVRVIRSEFAFTDVTHKDRLYDPQLAGGSNYDVNIYNLSLLHDLFRAEPVKIDVQARQADSGTDLSVSSILEFPGGKLAQLFSSIEMTGENVAWIYGTEGKIKMYDHWKCEKLEVVNNEGQLEVMELPHQGNGFYHEIVSIARSVERGEMQNPLMSWQDSLELITLVEKTENLIRKL